MERGNNFAYKLDGISQEFLSQPQVDWEERSRDLSLSEAKIRVWKFKIMVSSGFLGDQLLFLYTYHLNLSYHICLLFICKSVLVMLHVWGSRNN